MYGTIARPQVKPDTLDAFMQFGEREVTEGTYPEMVLQKVFQSDQNENEVWLVVGFSSREAYQSNAASPEQHERYLEMRSLLDADPEWHDGEVIQTMRS